MRRSRSGRSKRSAIGPITITIPVAGWGYALAMASALIELEEARRVVLDCVQPPASEPVALAAALGRALAEDVRSDRAVPGFDNSGMDGFALRCLDVRDASAERPIGLSLVDESRAGSPA